MANEEHLSFINQGVTVWNKWRDENPKTRPELQGASLSKIDLSGADLSWARLTGTHLGSANLSRANLNGAILFHATLIWANLSGANLYRARLGEEVDLYEANLSGANLGEADLSGADLTKANLSGADLTKANLYEAKLVNADLSGADLSGASLMCATMVDANLENANLNGCRVYGISAWELRINEATKQSDLIITQPDEATVTVGDLEVAQFIYLLLNRKKLRNVLDTITSKAVLLLGRFTAERKAILDALADELRKQNLLPIIFDFERSTNLDFTETIKILAGLSLFVIVDITKPKSAPQELTASVPDYQIPFVPIIEEGEEPYSMFGDFMKYDWVRQQVLKYRTKEELSENLRTCILDWAWGKHLELQRKKNKGYECISIKDMLARNERGVS